MNDKIYLLVRCTVKTTHRNIHDAIKEFQEQTTLTVTDTSKVQVIASEIVKLNTRKIKN